MIWIKPSGLHEADYASKPLRSKDGPSSLEKGRTLSGAIDRAEMPSKDEISTTVASVLSGLEAVRRRLDQTSDGLEDGEATVAAAALAEEIKHLCRQASSASDPASVGTLLAKANECLQRLEMLLGYH